MARFYAKLKALSKLSESKPILPITKQKWDDIPFIIQGADRCIPAWHYILVPHNKIDHLKQKQINETIDWTTFGSIITYRDNRNRVLPMSGWGIDPPITIQTWLNKNFDNKTLDENIKFDYKYDHIRLSQEGKKSRLEDLPNELLLDIFIYLSIKDLHDAFFNLNCRFNNLILSCDNVSLIVDENIDPLLIKLYRFKISHLTIDTSNECDLEQFSNLHSLIIVNRNLINIMKIRPEIFPNLVNLSFKLESDFEAPLDLITSVFSNRFRSLRSVNLGRIDKPYLNSWSISHSLKFVSIRCNNWKIVIDILSSCPNLVDLELHILYNSINLTYSSSLFTHPLKRFTLWSDQLEFSLDLIDDLLSYIPNVERLYLQTNCRVLFIKLAQTVVNRLHNLSRFDCFVKELVDKNERIDDMTNIVQVNSCFNRIKCIEEDDHWRIFATDLF